MGAREVTVRVPASTSNLGSGFDTLGLAVKMYLRVTAERTKGEGIQLDPASSNYRTAVPLILETARRWSQPAEDGYRIRVESEIPTGRGLGASAALRIGVLVALSSLRGVELSREQVLEHVYALEGHPDNASPATFGGFTVSGKVAGAIRSIRFEVKPELRIVTLLPNFEMPTGQARELLPEEYSRKDTAHSLNRAALITAAFASGNYETLRGLFDDVLHQPFREKLIPGLAAAVRAGEAAGALGGFLSGAGSGIICLALRQEEEIAAAMQRVIPESTVRILAPENTGYAISCRR